MFVIVLNKIGNGLVILRDFTPESLEYVNKIHLRAEEDDSHDEPFEFTPSPMI